MVSDERLLGHRQPAMASRPAPPPPPAPTTIAALGDDLLREIFLSLPAVTSLARAAFTCRAFLGAVRSSPAFRRRFRELHAPPLLALLLTPYMDAIVPAAVSGRGPEFEPDVAVSDVPLLDYDDDHAEWRGDPQIPYDAGYASFFSRVTDQEACYNPHSQALKIYPKTPRAGDGGGVGAFLEFRTLSSDGDEQRPSRVVCVHHERAWAWARVAVFSSHTMEWQVVLPETEAGTRLFEGEGLRTVTATVVNGFVCWVREGEGYVLALSTATFRFSRMDLPPLLRSPFWRFQLGQTKDGELCLVGVHQYMLFVWLWAADDDGVERFMLHKAVDFHTCVSELAERSEEGDVRMETMAVIDGFVYLSVPYFRFRPSPQWFLSLCLETAKVNLLRKIPRGVPCPFDPYILASWPSSLIHTKQDPETGVKGKVCEDDGPMVTEQASPVLFTALRSFKESLIDDGNTNFAEIDAFLLDDERNSLLNKIATLESRLAALRDRVLRLGTDESNGVKGMERGSWWHMCKGMLGRAWSQFFTW